MRRADRKPSRANRAPPQRIAASGRRVRNRNPVGSLPGSGGSPSGQKSSVTRRQPHHRYPPLPVAIAYTDVGARRTPYRPALMWQEKAGATSRTVSYREGPRSYWLPAKLGDVQSFMDQLALDHVPDGTTIEPETDFQSQVALAELCIEVQIASVNSIEVDTGVELHDGMLRHALVVGYAGRQPHCQAEGIEIPGAALRQRKAPPAAKIPR